MAFRSGLWRDVSRFKAPHLRGVASRAPFFHNGMSTTLADVVEHYDTIDNIGCHRQREGRPDRVPERALNRALPSSTPHEARPTAESSMSLSPERRARVSNELNVDVRDRQNACPV